MKSLEPVQLPPERPGQPASADLLARRARLPAAWTPEMLVPGTTARDTVISGVPCLVVSASPLEGELGGAERRRVGGDSDAFSEPAGMRHQPPPPGPSGRPPPQGGRRQTASTVLYFHGGGYRLGTPAAWAHFASRLAVAIGGRVIVPDYRLAPEYPFPAALHDATAVYRVLSTEAAPVVAGDSAGGGLAASLALACADALPRPAALVLFSPWLDLNCPEPANGRVATDLFFPRDSAREAAALYLQGHPPDDPLASPLKGDLAAFPPVLLFTSADEYLLDDARAFASRLTGARSQVETHIVPGMPHAWPTTAPQSPETEDALRITAAFIAAHV